MSSRRVLVGPSSSAHHQTLTAALATAAPGDVLLVSPGVYEETVHIDVSISVMSAVPSEGGEAEPADASRPSIVGGVVITATVTLENLEVRGLVDVRGNGRATLQHCDLHHGNDGARAHAGTSLVLRGCRVHHCTSGGDGVYLMAGASGEVSDTDIYECRVNGVHIQGSDAVLKNNRIRDCAFGLYYEEDAGGSCEGNTVEHASRFGIYITDKSCPTVCGNTVRECGILCLYVANGGRGRCMKNVFEGSVHTLANCLVQFSENQISGTADIDKAVAAPGLVAN